MQILKKLLLKLAQKYLMKVETDVRPADLITVGDNDRVYESIGIYYNESLKPFMFFRDDSGYIFSRPVYEVRRAKKVNYV